MICLPSPWVGTKCLAFVLLHAEATSSFMRRAVPLCRVCRSMNVRIASIFLRRQWTIAADGRIWANGSFDKRSRQIHLAQPLSHRSSAFHTSRLGTIQHRPHWESKEMLQSNIERSLYQQTPSTISSLPSWYSSSGRLMTSHCTWIKLTMIVLPCPQTTSIFTHNFFS